MYRWVWLDSVKAFILQEVFVDQGVETIVHHGSVRRFEGKEGVLWIPYTDYGLTLDNPCDFTSATALVENELGLEFDRLPAVVIS